MTSGGKCYQTIVAEVRPRLQSVNIFVKLNKHSSNFNRVILHNNGFEIVFNDNSDLITYECLNIKCDSLSALKVASNSISFRFNTTNNINENLGNFKTELLQNIESERAILAQANLLQAKILYAIECINCHKVLNPGIKFERVLPLPSENSDPSDWFCHAHNSNSQVNLNPNQLDLFYTHCYVHINNQSINNVKFSDDLIVCKTCLSWLGLNLKDALKLWSNTIQFKSRDNIICKTDSLTDVFNSIKAVMNNLLINSIKIILYCRTSTTTTDHILIWLLEKKLQLLMIDSGSEVKKHNVAKVLYKFASNQTSLVEAWQNDSGVHTICVSKSMLLAVLKHLHEFNKVFPAEFALSNDFSISYMFLYS